MLTFLIRIPGATSQCPPTISTMFFCQGWFRLSLPLTLILLTKLSVSYPLSFSFSSMLHKNQIEQSLYCNQSYLSITTPFTTSNRTLLHQPNNHCTGINLICPILCKSLNQNSYNEKPSAFRSLGSLCLSQQRLYTRTLIFPPLITNRITGIKGGSMHRWT
jgi:hypothetical protein